MLGTKETTQLTTEGSYTHPVYSKDGQFIAVNRKLEEAYDLVIIDKNLKEGVIASSVVSYSAPQWSATDHQLLFCGMVNGNQEIFLVDRGTGQEEQLTKNTTFDAMPTW